MKGTVTLIGAGPGEPELLTVKALRKLKEADVVFYDRLVNPNLLNFCKEGCELIDVGKKPNHHPIPQGEIEQLMIAKAKEAQKIVRLKSGDPYVFGRGGEEGISLRQQGIDFEVIPGVSSAIGGLAYAGIPITHRDFASSFHVVTGHLKSKDSELDWQMLAKMEGTLVFLMGMSELETITNRLLENGKDAKTPVGIVQWATRKEQRTVTGTLANIYEVATNAGMSSPSLIVMGGVVSLRDELKFIEERPLFGKSVGMPYTQQKVMYHQLIDQGATVHEFSKPVEVSYLAETHKSFNAEGRILFTNPTSIDYFVKQMIQEEKDWRYFSQTLFLTVGHHTEKRLKEQGILPAKSYPTIEEFLSETSDNLLADTQVIGSKEIAEIFAGLDKKVSSIWTTHEERLLHLDEASWQEPDILFFPNSKGAKLFINELNSKELTDLADKKIVVMGSITGQVFEAQGISVMYTAEKTLASVIEKIIKEVHK